WLTPALVRLHDDCFAGLWDGDKLNLCRGPLLIYAGSVAPLRDSEHVCHALLLPGLVSQPGSPTELPPVSQEIDLSLAIRPGSLAAILLGPGGLWCGVVRPGEQLAPAHTGMAWFPFPWKPSQPDGSPLKCPPLAWLERRPDYVELAGLGEN